MQKYEHYIKVSWLLFNFAMVILIFFFLKLALYIYFVLDEETLHGNTTEN